MIAKCPYETADGKRFSTVAHAVKHALQWTTAERPEYIWIGGLPKIRIFYTGAIEDVQ